MKLMKIDNKHAKRIHAELVAAGMTKYGLLKRESAHLPSIIHQDEHVHGVVYGLVERDSAMIVATDKRVLYLDHKIMFQKTDELSYDVVSGVSYNYQGRFAGVVLHTRLGDFKLRFVNATCAKRFVKFIEARQIETTRISKPDPETTNTDPLESPASARDLAQEAHNFLMTHEVATLSTVDENGQPHGAAVYYVADKNNLLYIVTKDQTAKARNIDRYPFVAVTITDQNRMQTMQIKGVAHVETDPPITKHIYETILRPRFQNGRAQLAPILHIPAGNYEVIVIEPTTHKLTDYKTT